MSAQTIYDIVPLGSLVRYFDGIAPTTRALQEETRGLGDKNNSGRLVRKSAPHPVGTHTTPASLTLHQGDFETFSVNSPLTFTVIERPKPGMVRIRDRAGEDAELLHLADTRATAEAWLASHRHPDAVLDEVAADEPAGAAASIHRLLEAHHCAEAEIADALNGTLTEDVRKHACGHSTRSTRGVLVNAGAADQAGCLLCP